VHSKHLSESSEGSQATTTDSYENLNRTLQQCAQIIIISSS